MRAAKRWFLLFIAVFPTCGWAALIRIDQDGDGDASTLSEGMAMASPGDTVAVRRGLHFTGTAGTSTTGGGIHVWWGGDGDNVAIRFNLIVDNIADEGGGIRITAGHPIIENNTVWGNAAPRGGAIYQELSEPGSTVVGNNILGGSLEGHAIYCEGEVSITLTCNCLHANAGGTYFGCGPGESDIHLDPQRCDKGGGDYGIASTSPCAPKNAGQCGLIGGFGVGCEPVSIQPASWAQIKARYRQ